MRTKFSCQTAWEQSSFYLQRSSTSRFPTCLLYQHAWVLVCVWDLSQEKCVLRHLCKCLPLLRALLWAEWCCAIGCCAEIQGWDPASIALLAQSHPSQPQGSPCQVNRIIFVRSWVWHSYYSNTAQRVLYRGLGTKARETWQKSGEMIIWEKKPLVPFQLQDNCQVCCRAVPVRYYPCWMLFPIRFQTKCPLQRRF